MNNETNILVTMTDRVQILQVALKVKNGTFDNDVFQFWAEPENRSKIGSLLPIHVQTFGDIVKVEGIFEIADLTK